MNSRQRHDRRRILKIFTIGGVATAVLSPSEWTRPIVRSVIVPAHAAASPKVTTSTTVTVTTAPPA
jgi:hypothetical protein